MFKKIVLLMIVGALVIIYKPEIINNGPIQAKIYDLRAQVFKMKKPDLESAKQVASATSQKVLGAYSVVQKENLIPGLPKEIVVDQVVNNLTDQVKKLPETELKQVKRAFCQDVIDEATGSAKGGH
jgi:hypothetical protein